MVLINLTGTIDTSSRVVSGTMPDAPVTSREDVMIHPTSIQCRYSRSSTGQWLPQVSIYGPFVRHDGTDSATEGRITYAGLAEVTYIAPDWIRDFVAINTPGEES